MNFVKIFSFALIAFCFITNGSFAGPIEKLKERESKVKKIVAESMSTVVAVVGDDQPATGSGVIVSEDGLIMTAGHVTEAAGKKLTIIFPDGRSVKGESLGANRSRDAGLARITEEGKWPFAKIGDSKKAKPGDWLIAMGHPGGYDLNRSPPIRLGRLISSGTMGMLRTDCTLVGGDSGGPLFNLEGEVIGIHSSIGGSLAENRHVPSSVFKSGWDRMLAGEIWGSLGMMAAGVDPDRPMLGVRMNESDGNVVVDKVYANSPAQRSGLKNGDQILSIDGVKADQMSDVVDKVASSKVGNEIELLVRRGKEEKTFSVRLVSWEDLASGLGKDQENVPPPPDKSSRPELGVILDAEAEAEGAVVFEVIENSLAASSGFMAGDVIKEINGTKVISAEGMASSIRSAEVGKVIRFAVQRNGKEGLLDVEVLFGK
ncbi:MAG: PDZ domain-containing protein [Verrucomicrobiales bacterium]|nr:PDZ domain-containing protein [Verrucomicrobiales bacterium]